MALIVEDGSGIPTAESYASVNQANNYHFAQGHSDLWVGADADKEAALRRGTQYIEANWRGRWPGTRVKYARNAQGLSWPRWAALDIDGFPILPTEIPIELIHATCEAALRELTTPGQLQPDLNLGAATSTGSGGLKREWAGDTGNEYYQATTSTTSSSSLLPTITVLSGILAPILQSGSDIFGSTERSS